jgi:hypothetical protein
MTAQRRVAARRCVLSGPKKIPGRRTSRAEEHPGPKNIAPTPAPRGVA